MIYDFGYPTVAQNSAFCEYRHLFKVYVQCSDLKHLKLWLCFSMDYILSHTLFYEGGGRTGVYELM